MKTFGQNFALVSLTLTCASAAFAQQAAPAAGPTCIFHRVADSSSECGEAWMHPDLGTNSSVDPSFYNNSMFQGCMDKIGPGAAQAYLKEFGDQCAHKLGAINPQDATCSSPKATVVGLHYFNDETGTTTTSQPVRICVLNDALTHCPIGVPRREQVTKPPTASSPHTQVISLRA